jgi:hypothetical protein
MSDRPEKIPLAKIVTTDDELFIVRDAYRAANGWAFKPATEPFRWLRWPRFASSVSFIPGKRIRSVEEVEPRVRS